MAKHTQTIRRQIADELLSVFGHFVNLAFKWLMRCMVWTKLGRLVSLPIGFVAITCCN